MERPLFGVLEGIDNSGKTTQSDLLKSALLARGLTVVQTREPGGTQVGEEIREVLLRPDRPKPINPLAQTLLFYAARVEFLNDVVKSNLSFGVNVIADRFNPSTHAYQGYAQGVPIEVLEFLDQEVVIKSGVKPDFCVIFDISAQESRLRLNNADNEGQIWAYEQMGMDFAEKVRQGYLEYARRNPEVVLIDGTEDKLAIHRQLIGLVDNIQVKKKGWSY